MTTALGQTLNLSYDSLRRLSSVSLGPLSRQYLYRDLSSTQTTTQVATVRYPVPGTSQNYDFNYTYDTQGNVTGCSLPDGTAINLTYDDQGQLLTVTGNSFSYGYTYDAVGNLLSAAENGENHTYTYGDADWKDLLTAYDGQSITYDGSGNPTSYYNGTRWAMGWSNSRSLSSATNGTTSISYTYDAGGMRTAKTVGTVTSIYFYASGKLLREIRYNSADQTTAVLDFFYSYDGAPYAMKYNGTVYYFLTNLQGDVVMILNADGSMAGGYVYDPYGKVLTATGTIAAINPLRYRGYYHDTETGFYYLHSRYYDPEIGRFINADGYASTGQGVIGHNMFTYCNNNPIIYCDSSGSRPMIAMNPSEETADQREASFNHMNELSRKNREKQKNKPTHFEFEETTCSADFKGPWANLNGIGLGSIEMDLYKASLTSDLVTIDVLKMGHISATAEFDWTGHAPELDVSAVASLYTSGVEVTVPVLFFDVTMTLEGHLGGVGAGLEFDPKSAQVKLTPPMIGVGYSFGVDYDLR